MKLTLWRVPVYALGAFAATAILMPNDGLESPRPSADALQATGAPQMAHGSHTSSWQAVLAATGR